MTKGMSSLLVMLWLAPVAMAQQSRGAVSATTAAASDQEKLIQLEKEWAAAGPRGDIGFFEHIAAEDYVIVDVDGTIRNKKEEIANFRLEKQTSQTVDDMKVRILDKSTAVVMGRFTIAGTLAGRPNNFAGRFTDVWVKRNGKWQVVSTQNTSLPTADSASQDTQGVHPAISASASGSTESEKAIKDEIINLEHQQWEAFKKRDRDALDRILADDYFDFGSDGRVDKTRSLGEGYMGADASDALLDMTFEDVQVKLFGDNLALMTRRGTYRATTKGKPESGAAFYSDLYVKRAGKWLSVFTQDSNLKCAGM